MKRVDWIGLREKENKQRMQTKTQKQNAMKDVSSEA